MLVQFMVKNVLSFKEETILDMSAVNAYKEHPCNLIDIGESEKFLRVAAIYGANASGKSNLHLAMTCFQSIIRKSLNNVEDGAEPTICKYFFPFSFDGQKENSEFQIVEILDGFEYTYGFEYNAECIVSEWLYRRSLKTGRRSIIFERTAKTVDFGASIRKECEAYREQIPADALVISFLNKLKLKTDVFKTVYAGIMGVWVVPADFGEDMRILKKFLPDIIKEEKEKFIEFLTAIDTGIKDIFCEDDGDRVRFFTVHQGRDGKDYNLGLFSESEGTIKSIVIFIYARIVILSSRTLFVDELNIKLHPLLLKFIVDLFYGQNSAAQLIYTTHDTTLMDKKFFRRDQIWFVQKDVYGYSTLLALSDFKVRSDASFEKDYLAGVYGGIPLLKEFGMEEGAHGIG